MEFRNPDAELGKSDENADMIETRISFLDEADSAGVSVRIAPHPELINPPPYLIEPAEQVVRAFSSASFRVSYIPNQANEVVDSAFIVADGEWLDDAAASANSLASASKSQSSFQSLVASVVSAGESCLSGSGADLNDGKEVDPSTTSSGNSSLAPGKSKRSPLRSFLKVELASSSVRPALTLDRRRRGPDLQQFLGFVVWSTRNKQHHSFFKTIIFSNPSPTSLPALLSVEHPFVISQCKCSASTQPALTKADTDALDAMRLRRSSGTAEADCKKVCLPPGATLAITLQFKPDRLVSSAHDINDRLRTTSKGLFKILYVNGDLQSVDLEGTVVEPTIGVAPPYFDFGMVHVETSASTRLRFSNPTVVPAAWRIEHLPVGEVIDDEINAAKEATVDDPTCWSFDLDEGVLEGPTLPLSSQVGLVPQGFDSDGKRIPKPINVCFSPSIQAQYESRFQVTVAKGVSFVVLLRGHGSYEEHHDNSVRRLPMPDYR